MIQASRRGRRHNEGVVARRLAERPRIEGDLDRQVHAVYTPGTQAWVPDSQFHGAGEEMRLALLRLHCLGT